jgi:hypothetical protein
MMSNPFFDHPILNSPYEYPRRDWELDEAGQPTQKIIDNREITQSQSWDEAAILARSKALLSLALGIWRLPETPGNNNTPLSFNVNA